MTAEEEREEEARASFSVRFLSQTLGLTFDVTTGTPVVVATRPVFTRPRVGDVLTAVNGADLAKCAIPVAQLVLMLESLPRPLQLSFVAGSAASAAAALATTTNRGSGGGKRRIVGAG